MDEVLNCFIYTLRQTQTAPQYNKHVVIEDEEGKKTQKCNEPYNLQIIIPQVTMSDVLGITTTSKRRGNNANVHTSQST